MDTAIEQTWYFVGLVIVSVVIKSIAPKQSYKIYSSLFCALIGSSYFFWNAIHLIMIHQMNPTPFIYGSLILSFIYKGSRQVAYKSITGVFSRTTGSLVGVLKTGNHWIDPWFEYTSVGLGTEINTAADLQTIKISIPETPWMQTRTRGMQAKVKHIIFMLGLPEGSSAEAKKALETILGIEGGGETIKERIMEFCLEFFLDEIGQKDPHDLDTDKHHTIENLGKDLKKGVNDFCDKNHYPYRIPKDSIVTIGDTELEEVYYEALRKKVLAGLEGQAENKKADMLKARIKKMGKDLLPGESSARQVEAALIALGITKKTIEEKKWNFDHETGEMFKAIALLLRPNNHYRGYSKRPPPPKP